MNKIIKNEYFILTIILILGFAVRLYKIESPIADWHSWRQADTASVSRTYVDDGINILLPRYQDVSSIQTGIFNPKGLRMVELPIYNVIHAVFAKNFAFFTLETWGRLLSAGFSIISAYFIYLLGKRLIGKSGGLWAAFFFAFIPYNIYFSRVILPEPLGVLFGVSSLWFFLKFIDKEQYRNLYLSATLFAFALLIKPFFIFYSLSFIYLVVKKYGLKKAFQNIKLIAALDIAIVPFFLWRVWVNRFPAGIPLFSWAFNGDNIRFRPAFWHWIFGERLGVLILGIWGLVPFSAGLFAKGKSAFSVLFFLGMVLYMTIVATASVRHDYYQILIMPAVCLILAHGTIFLWENKDIRQPLAKILGAFSIGMMLLMGSYRIKEFYKINHPEIIAAGKAVDKLAPKNALIVAPYNGDTAFLYQTKRWGWPVVEETFDEVIAKGASIYVSVNYADPDTAYVMKHYKVLEKTGEYVIADLTKPQTPK